MTVAGLSDVVTPLGAPVTANEMDCADPVEIAAPIVVVVELPVATLTDAGLADREKSLVAALVTVTDTVRECVELVPVPVTVTGYVPADAVPASMLSDEDPPAVIVLGLKDAVAPTGSPDADRAIDWAEP